MPRISVLMAAYNALPYLAEALDDILRQDMPDFELVVVDDASTDGTAAVLAAYAARDPRVVVVTNERNLRLPGALNRGIEACRAPLIARADADDRYPAHRLSAQLSFLADHPRVGLASTFVERIDQQGRTIGLTTFPTEDGPLRMRELFVTSFSHPAAIYRTELVRSVGGYDTSYWTAQDADLWRRLRQVTRAANLAEPLVRWRVHDDSISSTRGEKGEAVSLEVRRLALSDYLCRPVSAGEAEAAVRCFRDRPHMLPTAEQVTIGLGVLHEVREVASKREDAATLTYLDRSIAEALLSQSWNRPQGERPLRLRLIAEAFRWSPRRTLNLYREVLAA